MKKINIKNNIIVVGLLTLSIVLAGCGSTKPADDVVAPLIPANCSNWFDGCNNCFVEGGQIAGCTRMACETMQEAKCTTFTADQTGGIITPSNDIVNTDIGVVTPGNIVPKNCTSWFDGCNNCMVESGKVTACTLMYCEKPTEAKCTQFKTMDPSWDKNKDQINDCEKDGTCDDSVDYTLPKK